MAVQITIDTDAGYDDLLAILYLLADVNFSIDAITVVGGLCTDPQVGGSIIRYMVEQAGQPQIQVLTGVSQPQPGGIPPPAGWTNQVLSLGWPTPQAPAQPGAVPFLTQRLQNGGGILLAIGPFSNIAQALAGVPTPLGHFIAMGGAFGNPPVGNMPGPYSESEFNMCIDPLAANAVFSANLPRVLVPLNATGMVPIDATFISGFNALPETELVNLANQVFAGILKDNGQMVAEGKYDAWDPLAAAMIDGPNVGDPNPQQAVVAVDNTGVTSLANAAGSQTTVMMTANSAAFRAAFFNVFATGRPSDNSQVIDIT